MTETREHLETSVGEGENLCHIPDEATITGPFFQWLLAGSPGGRFEFTALCGVRSQSGDCYGNCNVCEVCNDLSSTKHP